MLHVKQDMQHALQFVNQLVTFLPGATSRLKVGVASSPRLLIMSFRQSEATRNLPAHLLLPVSDLWKTDELGKIPQSPAPTYELTLCLSRARRYVDQFISC